MYLHITYGKRLLYRQPKVITIASTKCEMSVLREGHKNEIPNPCSQVSLWSNERVIEKVTSEKCDKCSLWYKNAPNIFGALYHANPTWTYDFLFLSVAITLNFLVLMLPHNFSACASAILYTDFSAFLRVLIPQPSFLFLTQDLGFFADKIKVNRKENLLISKPHTQKYLYLTHPSSYFSSYFFITTFHPKAQLLGRAWCTPSLYFFLTCHGLIRSQ